jgi:hypothetical protein
MLDAKKPVKCYVWSRDVNSAENWTLRKSDQKHLESFKMCCRRRMEKISWTDRVEDEEAIFSVRRKEISYVH